MLSHLLKLTPVAVLALAPFASAQIIITRTFTPNLVIPDSGEAADVRTFDVGGGTISSLKVDLVMSGVGGQPMFNGDYYVTLGHNSASAVLLNRPGVTASNPYGYADNGIAVTFADNAANGDVHNYRTTLGGAPSGNVLTGTWAPDGRLTDPTAATGTATLSSFNGIVPSGEWRLFVSDEGAGGTAKLDLWRLHLTVTPDGATPMQLSDVQLAATSAQTLANPVEFTGASRLTGAADITFTGVLTGSGTVTKEDAGTLVLSQPNGFTGALAISGGTVQLPSGIGGIGGGITIASGASLQASGSITRDLIHQGTITGPALGTAQFLTFSGSITGSGSYTGRILMNGSFSPGNSPGIAVFAGDYTLGSLNLLTMELGGLTAGTHYDQIQVSNTLTFGGTLAISLINGFTPSLGDSFQLFTVSPGGTMTGSFSSFQLPSLTNSLEWNTTLLTSQGTLSVSAIPEPATVALGLGSVAFVGALLWHRRRKNTLSS